MNPLIATDHAKAQHRDLLAAGFRRRQTAAATLQRKARRLARRSELLRRRAVDLVERTHS